MIIIILALNWFSVAKMGTARIWMIIFAMIISINRPKVAKNEGISANKVKYSITSSLKFIEKNMNEDDKKIIRGLLK